MVVLDATVGMDRLLRWTCATGFDLIRRPQVDYTPFVRSVVCL